MSKQKLTPAEAMAIACEPRTSMSADLQSAITKLARNYQVDIDDEANEDLRHMRAFDAGQEEQ